MRKALRILAVALVLSLLVIPAAFAAEGDVYIGNVKFSIQQLLTRAYQDRIDQVLQATGGDTQQVVKIEYAGGKLYTLGTVADAVKSRQPGQELSEALEGKPTTAAPENPVPIDEWSPQPPGDELDVVQRVEMVNVMPGVYVAKIYLKEGVTTDEVSATIDGKAMTAMDNKSGFFLQVSSPTVQAEVTGSTRTLTQTVTIL